MTAAEPKGHWYMPMQHVEVPKQVPYREGRPTAAVFTCGADIWIAPLAAHRSLLRPAAPDSTECLFKANIGPTWRLVRKRQKVMAFFWWYFR